MYAKFLKQNTTNICLVGVFGKRVVKWDKKMNRRITLKENTVKIVMENLLKPSLVGTERERLLNKAQKYKD